MTRGSHVILFLLLCAGAGVSQSPSPAPAAADSPAGVAVVRFKWERIQRITGWDAPVNSAVSQKLEDTRDGPVPVEASENRVPTPLGRSTSSTQRERERSQASRNSTSTVGGERPGPASQPRPERGAWDYDYQLRIKNDSERRVESVDWEYLFLDPDTKKELGRHRFLSARRGKPGETFTLTARSVSPPARIVSAAALDKRRKPFDERVVVRCVAYSDGTFARREGADEADCTGLREATERARRRR